MPDNPNDLVPLELDDLVRVKSSGALAFISRLAGESSDEDSDDDSDDDSITDSRGRLIHWHDNPARRHEQTEDTHAYPQNQRRPLISQYDDTDDDIADNHESEQKFPDTPVRDNSSQQTPHLRQENHLANGDASRNSTQRVQVPEGSALVTMASSGNKVLVEEKTLEVLDRSLDPGSLVSPAEPISPEFPTAQTGIIETVSKNLYVRRIVDITPETVTVPDPATCFKVPAERLGFFSGIRAGDAVVRGLWVGAVDYFQEDVYVEFANGAIACVPGHRKALQNIDPRTPDPIKVDPFSEGQYYPGQKVKSSAHVWKNIAMWIRGAYSGVNEGVVKSVKIGDVGVDWVAKSLYANTGPPLPEDQELSTEVVRFSDITPLEAFRSLWWTVGDRGFLLNESSPSSAQPGQSHAWEEPALEAVDSDEEDGEWEEEIEDNLPSGLSRRAPAEASGKNPSKGRSRRQGGRLMKAQRRARERNGANDQKGTVTDVSLAHTSANPNDVVEVVGTETSVAVLWQDGTRSVNVSALQLREKDQPEPYDFWSGDLVARHEDFGDEAEKNRKVKQRGVIARLNPAERTALVKWQNEESSTFDNEEEMSIYELRPEATNMAIGDTVLHIPKDDSSKNNSENATTEYTENGQTGWVGTVTGLKMGECRVIWYGGKVGTVPFSELLCIHGEDNESYESNSSASDMDASDGLQLLSGEGDWPGPEELISALQPNWGLDDDDVIGGNDRDIEMQSPADATSETPHPTAFVIPVEWMENGKKVLRNTIEAMSHSGEMVKWKAIDRSQLALKATKDTIAQIDTLYGEMSGARISKQVTAPVLEIVAGFLAANAFSQVWAQSLKEDSGSSSSFAPRNAALFWTILTGALQEKYEMVVSSLQTWVNFKLQNEPASLQGIVSEQLKDDVNGSAAVVVSDRAKDVNLTASASETVKESDATDSSHEEIGIERFSLYEDLERFHTFATQASGVSHPVGFASIVRKEWARLKKHLPPGIWVRACENRNDQLRVTIVGPKDTPYADVLFFFDIWMGAKYPMEAPSLWFHSHGRRLNPNLYEDGKVCLSILGTWDGDDVESWDAATSNLLRVVLSLQALVFVDEPYYNEAGYAKQRGTEEGRVNSAMYNESAYLLSMKHVLSTLKSGGVPKDCAEIAAAHYKEHGGRILDRCKALIENHGQVADANNRDKHSPYSSAGFGRSLAKLLEPLEKAFSALL